MFFDQTIKNIKRIRETIQVLLKYGFEDIVTTTPLQNLVPQKMRLKWLRQERPIFEYSRWERIRMVAEELGPSFVKLGQILSNRPDILPEPLIYELTKLQENVPPFDFQTARAIVEKETGKSLSATFNYFEELPIGSASIGQVHRAKLVTGEDVVVKVQRPLVKEMVETDLVILREFVKLTENYFRKNGILNPLDIVATFEKAMKQELNYLTEARNIEQFRNIYRNHPKFYIPKVYKKLSTIKILVLEFVSGCRITDVKQLQAWGLNPAKVAENGMDIYLTQILEYGYFHADPHPGNILVTKDSMICLLDFGMVGKLIRQDKYAFAGIFLSMSQQDAKSMAINFRRLAIDSDIKDMKAFEYDLHELIEEYASLDVEELNIRDLAEAMQRVIYTYRLKVPGSVFLILRAMVILEGIGKMIHPDFKTFEFIKPYGSKILKEQFSLKNIGLELYYSINNLYTFANSFPVEVKEILQKLRKGQLHIQVESKGHEPLLRKLDLVSYRLAMALIVSALLIASAIIMHAPAAPGAATTGSIPVLSLIGFGFAVLLCLILFIGTFRGGKNK